MASRKLKEDLLSEVRWLGSIKDLAELNDASKAERIEDRVGVRLSIRSECFVPLIWEEVATLVGRHKQRYHSSHYVNRCDEGRGAHLETTFYYLFSRKRRT